MQNNYFFLKNLSFHLSKILINKIILQCFTQNKNELVLQFADNMDNTNPFHIQLSINPTFSCFNFPNDYRRANSNSVNIFEEIIGKNVKSIHQHTNERAFSLLLSNNFHLTFKMFGNKSNVLLFKQNQIYSIFQSNLKSDNNLIFNQLDRKIDLTFESFQKNEYNLQKTIPTLGNDLVSYLQTKFLQKSTYQNNNTNEFWQFVLNEIHSFSNSDFYIYYKNSIPIFSIVTIGDSYEKFENPIQALKQFYYLYSKTNGVIFEKNKAANEINSQINKLKKSIFELNNRLLKIETGIKNDELANIIMANIHQIPPKTESFELFDFYRNENIIVKFKKDLSPQKNAENYYRKSKNEFIEIETLRNSILEKQTKIDNFALNLLEIEAIDDIKEFRKYLKINGFDKNIAANIPESPFKQIEFEGFQILIGKNAINNDLLTLKFAKKDDLWFHARDVAGSHVVLRKQAGKNFPKNVIERAAQLAAYHSKRRNETTCPVIMTPKKFVRKPKNLAAGKVVLDKEETILVEPIG